MARKKKEEVETTESVEEVVAEEAKEEAVEKIMACDHCEEVHLPKKEAREIREMFHQAMRRSNDVSFRKQLKHLMSVLDKTLD